MKTIELNVEVVISRFDRFIRVGLEPRMVQPAKNEFRPGWIASLGAFSIEIINGYWAVQGPTPLAMAKAIHPKYGRVIRVAGDCSGPAPEEHITWRDPHTGREILDMNGKADFEKHLGKGGALQRVSEEGLRIYDFAEDPSSLMGKSLRLPVE